MVHSDWPIIVGGCYRSGTSLVRRILNAHSRIYCGPEVKFFRDFFGDYASDPIHRLRFFSSARSILPEPELLEIFGRAFIEIHERAAAHEGKSRWANKDPGNTRYLEQWQKLLGSEWIFIHIVRNPLDTLASMKGRFPLTLPPELGARIQLYLGYHQAGLDFADRFSDRYVRVGYEALVNAPREQIALFMSRLGESAQDQQLEFNALDHQAGLEDPKIHQALGIDPTRIGRWKTILTNDEVEEIRFATATLWKTLESGE